MPKTIANHSSSILVSKSDSMYYLENIQIDYPNAAYQNQLRSNHFITSLMLTNKAMAEIMQSKTKPVRQITYKVQFSKTDKNATTDAARHVRLLNQDPYRLEL